ncbi:MAG: hypothetical protein AB7F86_07730 [Bdellovibrionales bacterium]
MRKSIIKLLGVLFMSIAFLVGLALTVLVLALPSVSFAQDSLTVLREGKGLADRRDSFLYGENGKWILETVVTGKDGWPEIQSKKIFDRWPMGAQVLGERSRSARTALTHRLPTPDRELRSNLGSIWEATETWSWDWEVRYGDWVRQNVDKHFMERFNIATDCADVAISLRWIFARIHKLPMVNRIGAGAWFTNRSLRAEWANLPTHADWEKDQRFLKALDYLLDHAYTHTLFEDSYPIQISPQFILPGGHHLTLFGESGHTNFLSQVSQSNDEVPVVTLNGTVPRAVRELAEYIYMAYAAVPDQSAMLRIRWPILEVDRAGLVDSVNMPGYSLEQFAPDFVQAPRTQFWEEVYHRINPSFDLQVLGINVLKTLVTLFQQRVQVVEDGWKACQTRGCAPGTPEWEAWSTPSRDGRILDTIGTYILVSSWIVDKTALDTELNRVVLDHEGLPLSLRQLIWAWQEGLFSSDPNVSPRLRWGVHPDVFAERIMNETTSALQERESWAQKNFQCQGPGCEWGSVLYISESGAAGDKRLWAQDLKRAQYCGVFPGPGCDGLRLALTAQSQSVAGQIHSLWDWLDQSFHFVSDPRVPEAVKWNGATDLLQEIPLPAGHVALSVDDQWAFTDNGAKFSLFLPDGTEWTPPSQQKILGADFSKRQVFLQTGTELVVFDPSQASEVARMDLGETPIEARGHGNFIFAQSLTRKYWIARESGGLTVRQIWEGANLLTQNDSLVVLSLGSTVYLLDFAKDRVISADLGVTNLFFAAAIGGDYFLSGYGKTFLLRADGSSRLMFENEYLILAGLMGRSFISYDMSGGIKLSSFDADWNLIESEELGQVANWGQNVLATQKTGERTRQFEARAGEIHELPSLAKNTFYKATTDQYYLMAGPSSHLRVVDRNTNQELLAVTGQEARFTTGKGSEHFLIVKNTDQGADEYALMDVEKPHRFSILSGMSLEVLPGDYRSPTAFALFKNGRSLWVTETARELGFSRRLKRARQK